ncbi:MAG: hypothetical protein DRQ39_11655 [Gammaproteobacteria bacterium]|nr:MAG: hypothetical protein DRQ39_11655 [Gammaproteobacteria bacterium]
MKISITNIGFLPGVFAVTSDANPIYTPIDMLDSDFNKRYVSQGIVTIFSMELAPTTQDKDVSYVAIAGHNFGDVGGLLEVYVGSSPAPVVGSVQFEQGTRNNVVMITFPRVTTPEVIGIRFIKDDSKGQVLISNIQMGLTFDFVDPVNSAEPMGYKRIWLQQVSYARATIKQAAQPIKSEQERRANKMSLSIPNLQGDDFNIKRVPEHSNMYDFLFKISLDTLWYLKEYDGSSIVADNPRSSYLCFDTNMVMSAHSSTRALNNMKLTFSAYTGI